MPQINRRWLAGAVAAAMIVMTPAAADARGAATSRVHDAGPVPDRAAFAADVRAVAEAYLREFPGMTLDTAIRAADTQGERLTLLRRLHQETPAGFGGSWFDPRTNTQHVNVVGDRAANDAVALGANLGLVVATHRATYSFDELRAVTDQVNAGRHPALGGAGVGRATMDPRNNRVVVTLPADQVDGKRGERRLDGPIVTRAATPGPAAAPDVCTNRFACGTPLRSGIVLWAERQGNNQCSLGFTARATDGSRWAVTAGHCGAVTGDGGIWGHGEQTIGPIRQGRDAGAIDAARIHVTGSYWQTGGYMFNGGSPNTATPVRGYATYAQIQAGEGVCLNAWHSVAGLDCGVIDVAWDWNFRAMPRVNFDACGGDSGGGWYAPNGGERLAFGIHSSSTPVTCHAAGGQSWFTAVPDLHYWWDDTTAATLRIETR